MLPESPAFLWDAREAATKAATVAQGHEQTEYLRDWVLQAAVERQLEILGEPSRICAQPTLRQQLGSRTSTPLSRRETSSFTPTHR